MQLAAKTEGRNYEACSVGPDDCEPILFASCEWDEFRKSIRSMVAFIAHVRRLPSDRVEDTVQEVLMKLWEIRTPEFWGHFRKECFDTIEYRDAQKLILKAISAAIAKLNEYHRIAVNADSVYHDASLSIMSRQRRILPRDINLGDSSETIVDENARVDIRDLCLDLKDTMSRLPESWQRVVVRRVNDKASWKTIGKEFGKDGNFAQAVFYSAMQELAKYLKSYRSFSNQ